MLIPVLLVVKVFVVVKPTGTMAGEWQVIGMSEYGERAGCCRNGKLRFSIFKMQ